MRGILTRLVRRVLLHHVGHNCLCLSVNGGLGEPMAVRRSGAFRFCSASVPVVKGGSNLKPGGWGLLTQRATFNSVLPNNVNEAMRPKRSCTGENCSSDVSSSHLKKRENASTAEKRSNT